MKIFISTPVWGENHIGLWLRYGLPSLMASGNLPYLCCKHEVTLIVHTDDAASIVGEWEFRRFRSLLWDLRVEVRRLPEIGGKYQRCAAANLDAMQVAGGEPVLFLPPDMVWSTGTLRRVSELLEAGKRVIHTCGIRLDKDKILPMLFTGYGVVTCRPRDLIKGAAGSLHENFFRHTWTTSEGTDEFYPSNIFWTPVRDIRTAILAHCFHLHPLMVWPEVDCRVDGTVDDDLALKAVPDFSKHHVVQDSDELVGFEISPPGQGIGELLRKGDLPAIMGWVDKYANPLHRWLVDFPIWIHDVAIDPAVKQAAELEARSALNAICLATVA